MGGGRAGAGSRPVRRVESSKCESSVSRSTRIERLAGEQVAPRLRDARSSTRAARPRAAARARRAPRHAGSDPRRRPGRGGPASCRRQTADGRARRRALQTRGPSRRRVARDGRAHARVMRPALPVGARTAGRAVLAHSSSGARSESSSRRRRCGCAGPGRQREHARDVRMVLRVGRLAQAELGHARRSGSQRNVQRAPSPARSPRRPRADRRCSDDDPHVGDLGLVLELEQPPEVALLASGPQPRWQSRHRRSPAMSSERRPGADVVGQLERGTRRVADSCE